MKNKRKISIARLIRAILLLPILPVIAFGALLIGDINMIKFYYGIFKKDDEW